ncbi:MAG: YbaK/EbsC family protein [Candidatus Curtissbacteria bacterium]|nr:YbaK/EbsC family protein [Candidatus Curtissbacteria bacterium]
MAVFGKIEKFLKKEGIDFKIIDFGQEVLRVEDVIKFGINPKETVKTLIIKAEKKVGFEFKTVFIALAIRGQDRLNFKKVKRLFGTKAELAKPEEVLKVVKVPVGAVCPVLVGIPLYFDRKALKLKRVNLGSGDLTKGLNIDMKDLLKAVGDYEIVDLT